MISSLPLEESLNLFQNPEAISLLEELVDAKTLA
jgi:hypothetical protein